MVAHFEGARKKGDKVAGQGIRDLVTVNGVRVTVEEQAARPGARVMNKPELVVVVESPVSEARSGEPCSRRSTPCCACHPEVGEYNQTV